MASVVLIGLDIGSTSVRAVETARSRDGLVITNFSQVALPEGAVLSGAIQDPNAVTVALKQLWATAKFRSREVILGVTNPQVVVREMSVLNLPPRELRKSLPFQVRDAMPLPVERSVLDFCPLENPQGKENVRGLLVAAPKDAVLTAVHAIERAGLHVTQVDLASFALLRATARLDSSVEAIIDIGAHATSVVVHTNGVPLIVRTIPRGGAEITEMISSRLRIPFGEAEALKCRVGLRTDIEPGTVEVIEEAVRPLISEIRSSFAYLTAGDRQSLVTRLALSGGGAMLPGLVDVLNTQLEVEVVLADPTIRLAESHNGRHDGVERFRSAAAVSIGLTLGAA